MAGGVAPCLRVLLARLRVMAESWVSGMRAQVDEWEKEYREEKMKKAKAETHEPRNLTNAGIAQDAQLGGNTAVLGPDGNPIMMSEEDYGDKLEHYEWSQNDGEVHVKVYVPKATKAKDVTFVVSTSRLKLDIATVDRRPMFDGRLYDKVAADEALWTFEEFEKGDERAKDSKILTFSLEKLRKTQSKVHWKTVVVGEPEIDTNKFGPAIMQVNPDNPNEIANVISEITANN